jgi:hypothetical protein
MDFQVGFNIAMMLAGFLGGWVLNNLRTSIDNLHTADSALTGKIQRVEVLVAGEYVRRDDLDKLTTALFAKLDRIEIKIDGKADK